MDLILNILVGICYVFLTLIVFGLFYKMFFKKTVLVVFDPTRTKSKYETCRKCKAQVIIDYKEWAHCHNCHNLVVQRGNYIYDEDKYGHCDK